MTLDTDLELVTTAFQVIVLSLLIARRVYKSLPIFSSYLAWLLFVTCTSFFFATYHPALYDRAYLYASIVDSAFMFCVLVELSMSVLSPIRSSLPRWTFLAVGSLLAIVFAGIWPFTKPPGLSLLTSTSQYYVHLDIASSVLRLLVFLALAGCSQLLSIGWRDRELQIATGLGFYSFVSLAVTVLHMNQGIGTPELVRQYHVLEALSPVGFLCSMGYWIVSFAQKVPERRKFTPQMENFLLALAGNAHSTRVAMKASSQSGKDKRNK